MLKVLLEIVFLPKGGQGLSVLMREVVPRQSWIQGFAEAAHPGVRPGGVGGRIIWFFQKCSLSLQSQMNEGLAQLV